MIRVAALWLFNLYALVVRQFSFFSTEFEYFDSILEKGTESRAAMNLWWYLLRRRVHVISSNDSIQLTDFHFSFSPETTTMMMMSTTIIIIITTTTIMIRTAATTIIIASSCRLLLEQAVHQNRLSHNPNCSA